jgi:DNA modification methylase
MSNSTSNTCNNSVLPKSRTNRPKRNITLSKPAQAKIAKLVETVNRNENNCWTVGDICSELLERHRVPLGYLSQTTGYSKARLSEFHLTAAAFGKRHRNGFSFQNCLVARKAHKRFPSLKMSLIAVRNEVKRCNLRSYREAKTHFVAKMVRQQAKQSFVAAAKICMHADQIINQCHHSDYRQIIPKLPDQSIKLLMADPPFSVYRHRAKGEYISGKEEMNGLRIDCDYHTPDQALQVTLDLFSICKQKMTDGGALLLFQAGAKPDRPEILEAAEQNGWDCRHALTWLKTDKPSGTPCDCTEPYGVATEKVLVFVRAGDKLQWHEQGLSRSDVLSFPSITKSSTTKMAKGQIAFHDIHMFQKPLALMEFLIRKHTYPGELVVEPFGCSGAGCIAAAELNRRWLYAESNRSNFDWGSERIRREMEQISTAAS